MTFSAPTAVTAPLTGRAGLTLLAFSAAAVLSVEVSLRLAWPRSRDARLSRDFLGVWTLPVAFLLPPPYVAVMAAVPALYIARRLFRWDPIRVTYSIASIGLSYAAASWVHQVLTGHHGVWTVGALAGGNRQILAMFAAVAVWWVTNFALIGAVIAATAGRQAVLGALRDVDGLVVDAVETTAGILTAVAFVVQPLLAACILPATLLMQHQLFSGLRAAVRTDLLTDVASGHYWRAVAGREVQRAKASGSDLSLLVVDLDDFKSVNDRHGHLVGDAMLAAAARAITTAVRPRDLVGRLGGEEFGVLLAGLNLLDAEGAAQRVRAQIATTRVRGDDGRWVTVTASIGVAAAGVHGVAHARAPLSLPIASDTYTVRGMADLYEIEVEPEVRSWLEGLTDRDFGRVDFLVGLLAERAETLGEPYSRHLGGQVRELRFHLLRQQTRVTYWLAPDQRVVLLTVFRKTRSAETAEVQRAVAAQRTCEAIHDVAHDIYEREGKSR